MGFGSAGWLEFKNPWWFLLFVPIALGLFWRFRAHTVIKAHTYLAPLFANARRRTRVWCFLVRLARGVPSVLRLIALGLFVFILVDVTRAYVLIQDRQGTHRVFVLIDSSSSMYGFNQTRFKSITCKIEAKFFPRTSGACRALYRLVEVIERFNAFKTSGAKDLVALGQFASRSYVVAYPTNDYARLRERIDRLEFFSSQILGFSTDMHLAIWDMYLMAFERNRDRDSGFIYLSDDDLRKVSLALAPGPLDSSLVFPEETKEKLEKIRREFRDTTFIIITDAVVEYLRSRVETATPQSIRRQMQFAEFMETPFYYLSTDEFYPELARLAHLTGYGPPDAKSRGNFIMVKHENDFAQMQELIDNILQSRLIETVPVQVERRESYAENLAIVILTLITISIVWKKCLRSLTECE